jgi:hypothetical protein
MSTTPAPGTAPWDLPAPPWRAHSNCEEKTA